MTLTKVHTIVVREGEEKEIAAWRISGTYGGIGTYKTPDGSWAMVALLHNKRMDLPPQNKRPVRFKTRKSVVDATLELVEAMGPKANLLGSYVMSETVDAICSVPHAVDWLQEGYGATLKEYQSVRELYATQLAKDKRCESIKSGKDWIAVPVTELSPGLAIGTGLKKEWLLIHVDEGTVITRGTFCKVCNFHTFLAERYPSLGESSYPAPSIQMARRAFKTWLDKR